MMAMKPKEKMGPGLLVLISIIVFILSLAYALVLPEPGVAGIVTARVKSLKKIEDDLKNIRAQAGKTEAAVRPRLWRGDAEAVTAAVLQALTLEANRRKVNLSAFRPQRPLALEGVMELPFSVQLSGPYPAVRAVAASLDRGGSQLALRSIQVASMDAASSAVTATLGLSAYAAPSPEEAPKTGDIRG
ncbi:MAG: hypothetical protein IT210_20550 [Armatimonadetes bacterium]|nr:hypothetical protein [Armatimonadota bacterium]